MNPQLEVSADAGLVAVGVSGRTVVSIDAPVVWSTLDGAAGRSGYDRLSGLPGAVEGFVEVRIGQARLRVEDRWISAEGAVTLRRVIHVEGSSPDGVRLELRARLAMAGEEDRFLIPGMISSPGQHAELGEYLFADDRLGYPAVAVWSSAAGEALFLARKNTGIRDAAPVRARGEQRFMRDTDLGALGFVRGERVSELVAAWPTAERDRSSQLDAAGTPFETFHPLRDGLKLVLEYEFRLAPAARFVDAVEALGRQVVRLAKPTATDLPVSYAESIDLRLDSAAKTYTESATGLAGFRLNFDPELGYYSQAKAFGASFADHAMGGSHEILEYGFTGRQLNLAFLLARRDEAGWGERARKVVDSFVERLATESGWVATLFDLAADEPVYACGDRRGPVMHYLGRTDIAGTYTRMMVEACSDLLLNARLHGGRGADVGRWLDACRALADFFVRVQNDDGSWFRAYAPDGTPIVGDDWFGDRETSGKSATGAVIPYLLAVADLGGEGADRLRSAAAKAGGFVLLRHVQPGEFRGGTLDNPNLVDKEAAFLAMRALLALDRAGVEGMWRGPATEAAWFALLWHSLWEVPNVPGTVLDRARVRSVGWGGINSVWGVGVTDIYSLFFAGELHTLGAEDDIPEFRLVAELIAASSLQLLSVPGSLHGFTDTGMQPEGISFCNQGADDGLITKGDTWGGLGWPYTAGTLGLLDYLTARDAAASVPRNPTHHTE